MTLTYRVTTGTFAKMLVDVARFQLMLRASSSPSLVVVPYGHQHRRALLAQGIS
jgi:hypothetical protein